MFVIVRESAVCLGLGNNFGDGLNVSRTHQKKRFVFKSGALLLHLCTATARGVCGSECHLTPDCSLEEESRFQKLCLCGTLHTTTLFCRSRVLDSQIRCQVSAASPVLRMWSVHRFSIQRCFELLCIISN